MPCSGSALLTGRSEPAATVAPERSSAANGYWSAARSPPGYPAALEMMLAAASARLRHLTPAPPDA